MTIIPRSKTSAELMEDPGIAEGVGRLAGDVARDANQTSAKIGIITYRHPDGVLVTTSRGTPALALEIGGAATPAKRYVKRALDRREQ